MDSLSLQLGAWESLFLAGGSQLTVLLAVGAVSGALGFFAGLRLWRWLRWVEDVPTSKVRTMPLGRVELQGRAQEKAELRAPFSSTPCVYYRYKVEEHRRQGTRSRWAVIDSGDSRSWPFYLEDETGRVLIDPEAAEIQVRRKLQQADCSLSAGVTQFLDERGIRLHRRLGGRRRLRISEWRIEPAEPLYVLGVAQERASLVEERRHRIHERLAALKRDPEAMAHLDTDGDGSVSAEEWEVARRLVVEEVAFAREEDRIVVTRGEDGRSPFLVSDQPEPVLLRSLRWRAFGGIYGGSLLNVVCLAILLGRAGLL